MNNGLKVIILILALLSIFGCKKEGSENESNLEVESYDQTSFNLVDQSLGPASSIEKFGNDEYILLGAAQGISNFSDMHLTKIDYDCNTIWTKSYPGSVRSYNMQALKVDDGMILLGSKEDFVNETAEIYMIKTDVQGEELWSKSYGLEGNSSAKAIMELEDGSFIILGHSGVNTSVSNKYIIKIDENGEELWSRKNEFSFSNVGLSIAYAGNDEYLLMGKRTSPDGMGTKLEVEKIGIDGNSIWIKQYESVGPFFSRSKIIKSNEGGFLLISNQESDLDSTVILVLKIDEFGNQEWSKTYGGDNIEGGYDIHQTIDNQYLILGTTRSFGNGKSDIIVVKINQLGEQIWAKSYGGRTSEGGFDLTENDSGEILICGSMERGTADNSFDLLVFKLDSNGNPI